MGIEHIKTKSAAKIIIPDGDILRRKKAEVLEMMSNIVGGTLGPGGKPVLIEREEVGIGPTITKDGVTVMRSLSEPDSVKQCILEAARDAAIRTASEAGDGTTTATILSEALVRHTTEYCLQHPEVSPRSVVQHIQDVLDREIVPRLTAKATKVSLDSPVLTSSDDIGGATDAKEDPSGIYGKTGRNLAKAVATISGNGDVPLADAVLKCFDICGNSGNVTIVDSAGSPSRYEVERVEGFPISVGFEQSCSRFYPAFINDSGTQKCMLDSPVFVLYYGRVNDYLSVFNVLNDIQHAWESKAMQHHNVVFVATGFSESVLAGFSGNFLNPGAINIFPLLVPNDSPIHNATKHFLDDLAAITNTQVYDQITNPLDRAQLKDLGNVKVEVQTDADTGADVEVLVPAGVTRFEAGRFRSTVLGSCNEDMILIRASEIESMIASSMSDLDRQLAQERLAILTGGIARLKVIGGSNGELKERRDRAEDAICAVRGALVHGCLPAGGWGLAHLIETLPADSITEQVLVKAFKEPITRLYENAGLNAANVQEKMGDLIRNSNTDPHNASIYNCLTQQWDRALDAGLVDSFPAVLEAIKNSISIATLLGTLGGVVVFPRNAEAEMREARDYSDFMRNANVNPANERV